MSVPTYGLSKEGLQHSEVVTLEVIKQAKTTLKISQQSILFMYGGKVGEYFKGEYSNLIIQEIREAIKRGVKVEILVSADQCKADNNNDYNGMPIDQLRNNTNCILALGVVIFLLMY